MGTGPAEPKAASAQDHSMVAARRVRVAGATGVVVAAVVVALGATWSVAALAASDAAALTFVVWVWMTVGRANAAATERIAGDEDSSRLAGEVVLVAAGAASLVAVLFVIGQAGRAVAPERGLLTALALGSVALAWTSVHTVYALRYARLYYSPPTGGVDFAGEAPGYLDFAYLALTVGMTFQISDTNLTSGPMRRLALRHALLSYLFGTIIVAITVSSVAGLLGH